MNSLDTEFGRRLAKRITETLVDTTGQVMTGQMEHPNYKHACGYAKALGDVQEWCEQIDKDMRTGK